MNAFLHVASTLFGSRRCQLWHLALAINPSKRRNALCEVVVVCAGVIGILITYLWWSYRGGTISLFGKYSERYLRATEPSMYWAAFVFYSLIAIFILWLLCYCIVFYKTH